MTDVQRQWRQMLGAMLLDYRHKNPRDESSDDEILLSLLEYFHSRGLIGKTEGGKYILCKLAGAIPFVN